MTANRPTPPRLADLTARYLAKATAAPAADDLGTDVEPHEAIGGFRADPRTGWAEAAGFARCFRLASEKLTALPDWATYAALPVSAAVPLAGGTFPQMLRDAQPLLGTADLSAFLPRPAAPVAGLTGLRSWLRKALTTQSPATLLTAAGVAAELGDADVSEKLLAAADPLCVGEWRAAWENQRAAGLWLAGQHADALAAWQALGDHPVAAFNAGMALLFLGRAAEAVPLFKLALDGLPAGSGWASLANLLLLAAQARG
jgi:hypothetical protein